MKLLYCPALGSHPMDTPEREPWPWKDSQGRRYIPRPVVTERAKSADPPQPDTCPLPTYHCACKGRWCRLLGRNLDA